MRHPHATTPWLAGLMLLVSVSSASAINLNEWVPGLKFSPFVTERAEYETNVFQERSDVSDALALRTIPGFTLDYEAGPLKFSTGYRAEFLNWIGIEDQDNIHHIAFVQTGLELTRLTVRLADSFTRTSDPPQSSDITGRIESVTNVLSSDLEYKLTSRLSTGLGGSWTHVNFDRRNETLDRNEYRIGPAIFWKVFPRADVSFGYNYSTVRFVLPAAENRDSNQHEFLVGLRGDLTAKLSSTLRVGYAIRESEGTNQQDTEAISVGGDLVYRITERTRLSLLASRRFEETTFGTSTSAGFFVSTSGTLLAEHQFSPKLNGNARFSISNNDYPTNEADPDRPGTRRFREDTILGWGGGLDYEIQKWLQVGAEYSHTRRDSNFIGTQYKNDKITGKITLIF